MKVLVTGNNGYIGAVLTDVLADKGYDVIGLDTNYYKGIIKRKHKIKQIIKDIRDITKEDLKDVDAVIHLAALSNDPLGEFNPKLTEEINYKATIKLARLAKDSGVKRFVYSSSQSMYGISDTDEKLDEENSEKKPLTAYAKTKWDAETSLKKMSSDDFIVVCFRPSTVFGSSPSLRSDIVFNNLVGCAYTTGKIEIKSDGSPWRPVIHVRDVSNAFIAGLEAPKELVENESFNVGIENGNFTVKDLAEAAQKVVPGSKLTFTGEHGQDSRTYRVSFKKILSVLKDYYKPEWDLIKGGKELVEFYKKHNFTEEDFRGKKTNRLLELKYLVDTKELNEELFWGRNEIKQAVILAGGVGERLKPLTNDTPKPMILINRKPFLEYLINLLKENGIEEVVLLLGYLPKKIMDYFGDGSKFGVKIKYSVGEVEFETGKRIKYAEKLLDDKFLLMYCDNYLPIDLKKLSRLHNAKNVLATVTIYTNKDNFTKNNIRVDDNNFVTLYDKSREEKNLSGVDVGFFILNKKVLDLMPDTNFSFEKEIIPRLVEKRQLYGYLTDQKYYSIGDLDRLPITEKFLKPKKAIFIDRDGVICEKAPKADYIKKWSEFKFLPGATKAISMLTNDGYDIFIVSNQPGIARGVMTEEDFKEINNNMIKEIEEDGGKIKGAYYCKHGRDENCDCRKPKPGLLFQASKGHYIDLTKTYVLGDDERDIEAAEATNAKSILITQENNLLSVVKGIIKNE